MEKTKNRLNEMNNIILNVAGKNGEDLELGQLPGSRLSLPEHLLADLPEAVRNNAFNGNGYGQALVRGHEYFRPGMTAVILGCQNHLLNYMAAKYTAPGGTVTSLFTNRNNLEKTKQHIEQIKGSNGDLSEIRFHYAPHNDLRACYLEIEQYLKTNQVTKLGNG